jgi:hypothetical protein
MNKPIMITREELYERIWKLPATKLAKELGISDVALAKICRKLNVPKPGKGHWRLVQLGWEVERPPLPELAEEGASKETIIDPEPHRTRRVDKKPAAPSVPAEAEVVSAPSGAAERGVLDLIRQATRIDFWRESISRELYPGNLAVWLGVGAAESTLERAVKDVRKEYSTFRVEVKDERDRYGQQYLRIKIVLREGCEWRSAWEEAWACSKNPNPHCLSNNALRLYLWAKGPKNTGELTERRKIGAQARLRRTYDDIEDHLREIRLKADADVQWEKKGEMWRERFRVWFEQKEIIFYHYGPINPALGLDLRTFGHAELERFKEWLHEEVMRPGFPEERETIGIFDIRDRKTLKAVFSRLPEACGIFAPDPDFFGALRLVKGVVIAHEFANGMGPWIVTCRPEEGVTWSAIKETLVARAREIPLERRYTLGADSRALLKWILDLRSDEYLLGMTPPVEDHLERDIGLRTEVGEENVKACVELLLEEINEQTEFNLRAISWQHYSKEQTRILVRKKRSGFEEIVRAVQVWGLARGKLLEWESVKAALGSLVGQA